MQKIARSREFGMVAIIWGNDIMVTFMSYDLNKNRSFIDHRIAREWIGPKRVRKISNSKNSSHSKDTGL